MQYIFHLNFYSLHSKTSSDSAVLCAEAKQDVFDLEYVEEHVRDVCFYMNRLQNSLCFTLCNKKCFYTSACFNA